MNPEGKVQLSFRVDEAVHTVHKVLAASENESLTARLQRVVTDRAHEEVHRIGREVLIAEATERHAQEIAAIETLFAPPASEGVPMMLTDRGR